MATVEPRRPRRCGSAPSWPHCRPNRGFRPRATELQVTLADDFIDRIVDGGLTPAQFRAALDRLEREPHGWSVAPWLSSKPSAGESFRADQPSGNSRPDRIADGNTGR